MVLAISTSLALAAPAHAYPVTNAGFVSAIGKTEPEVADEVAEQNPNIGPGKAQRFTALAQQTYCPQYLPQGQ